MPRMLLLLTVLAILAGCASAGAGPSGDPVPDGPISDDDPQPPAGDADEVILVLDPTAMADGPGISVSEALQWTGQDGVLVNGAVFVDPDGTVRLCEAIAESFPPQCGGARLVVEGADFAAFPDLQEANGIRWSESVQLYGRIEQDR